MTAGPIADTRTPSAGRVVSSDVTARVFAIFAVLNVVAIAMYGVVAAQMGLFTHLSDTLFWSPDSHTYRDVAHWLLGTGPYTLESTHRPFLYPLLLGLAEAAGGSAAIWALNFVSWIGMVNLTAVATLRLTRRLWIAAIVFLVVAANASLIVLSMQALTEPVTGFLLSVWILGLAISRLPPSTARDVAMVLAPISLLTVVRPQFEVALLIALALLTVAVWRLGKDRAKLGAVMVACCAPVLFQVGLMATVNHTAGISESGGVELKLYFASQVYSTLNGLPDDLVVARTVVGGWTDAHTLAYLSEHPRTTAATFASNLHRNLTAPSNFVNQAQLPALANLITNTNRLYLKVHVIFLPIVALAFWRRRDVRLLFLYLFAALVIVLPSLIVDQGDRYIAVALPLWAAAYGLAVADLLPDLGHLLQRRQRTAGE